jgi:hypothetical protein
MAASHGIVPVARHAARILGGSLAGSPLRLSTLRASDASAPLRSNRVALVTKDFQRTTLEAHHRPVVRALAEAMFSPDGEVSAERLDAFVDDVDSFISPTSKTLRLGLLTMLFAIRWSPLLFLRFKAFDELTVEERVHHLERLERSKVKQLPLLVVAYKTILTMVFYEDADEQRSTLGYPGDERKRWRSLPIAQAHADKGAA